MALTGVKASRIKGLLTIRNFYDHKFLHTSPQYCVNFTKWEHMPKPPYRGTKEGPLVDLPDWSYADGRPAPLGSAQKRRIRKNMEYCEQIVKLTKEIDDAVELSRKSKEEEELKMSLFLQNRLKSKGDKRTQRLESEKLSNAK